MSEKQFKAFLNAVMYAVCLHMHLVWLLNYRIAVDAIWQRTTELWMFVNSVAAGY